MRVALFDDPRRPIFSACVLLQLPLPAYVLSYLGVVYPGLVLSVLYVTGGRVDSSDDWFHVVLGSELVLSIVKFLLLLELFNLF